MKEAAAPPSEPKVAETPANHSSGMAALLHGKKGETATAAPSPASAAPSALKKRLRLLQASLVLADLLLLGLVARLAFKPGVPLKFVELVLGFLAILTGAWLSCLALWLESKT